MANAIDEIRRLSVREIKRDLAELGVSTTGCFEKEELVQKLHQARRDIDTSNDEMIARALASAPCDDDSVIAQRLHASQQQQGGGGFVSTASIYPGHRRQSRQGPIADATIQQRAVPQQSASSLSNPPPHPGGYSPFVIPIPRRQRVQMCHVPCILGSGDYCLEMMVDTGAETSVMSLQLARRLGLERSIDRREQGVASGVGQAMIVGKVRRVICTLGHVEFPMDFAVLDLRGGAASHSQNLLILGMDQLRHYNCIIDLHKDALIFGGPGGVEVPLLPPDQQPTHDYYDLRNACSIS